MIGGKIGNGSSWVYTESIAYTVIHEWEVHLELYIAKVDFPSVPQKDHNIDLNFVPK